MKIAKLEQIGLSLGITKQAVSKEFVKKGLLIKNEAGQVDIEQTENRKFLKSKGANMDMFYPKKGTAKKAPAKAKKKPPPRVKKPKTPPPPVDVPKELPPDSDFEALPENSNPQSIVELETETRREKWKGMKKDNELKDLKLQETKGRLFDGQLVQNIIFDILSVVSSMVRTMADACVDEIISICQTDPENARDRVKEVILKYASTAMAKAISESKKTFRKVKRGLN